MSRASAVKKLYQIFVRDPLLLQEQNQVAYGTALLWHLLVYRPLTTSDPYTLDLHDPASVAGYAKHPPLATQLDPGLRNDYLIARRDRSPLPDAKSKALREVTMATRGEFTRDRQGGLPNHASQRALLKQGCPRLCIAAVGYRVGISKIENIAYVGEDLSPMVRQVDASVPKIGESPLPLPDAQLGRTIAGTNRGRWETAIVELIDRAIQEEPNIIVLPEFALPSQGSAKAVPRIDALCARAKHDFFLFAGSRHEERYNRGLIFSRKGTEVKTWWHYKTASARGLGETTIGPAGTRFPNYQLTTRVSDAQATVGIAICYDAYDPTYFLNMVLDAAHSNKDFVPKIVIVPSFNPGSEFVELLRDLSFLAQCTVVYVNGLHGDARAFVCGVDVADLVARYHTVISTITDEDKKIGDYLKDEADRFADEKKRNNRHVRTQEEQREIDRIKTRQKALKALHTTMLKLHQDKELDATVTVADCYDCTHGNHQLGDHLCFRDIMFFNLSTNLLVALHDFRRDYFADEEFLPEPFRFKNLEKAIADI